VRRSPLWREFESGDTTLLRALRFVILAGGVLFLCFAGVLDLTWQHQAILTGLTLILAVWIGRSSKSYQVTLTLLLLSVFSTLRYGFWRVSSMVAFFRSPATHWTWLDAFFIVLLLLAECYAFVVLVLGYLQTLWPLRRAPVPLPDDPEDWPAVDLLIPTYDEPLSVVRFTALAAMNIDWPAEKLNVYILDDGRREEFRAFAEEAGIGYMTRDDNQHAKAGNINCALARINSPFVAVFDCDHVPTRSFLQLTMGWFLRDNKLAVLQTPHHFYSPDPFDRNLDQFRAIPSEDELFYRVVQDGNDFWNAAFFCGSCAVLRRSALDEVGGVAVETVTEDAHTSLRLQMGGWNTAYINIPQAAGLATERLSGHVRQRVRWARGMVQILRIENPLFVPGLKPAQRLCYFNAMSHYLYALPRLIFLTAPLIYLIFGMTNIPGFWIAIVAYALPHLVLSNLTNSRMQGKYRHSFWNEIYETVLAPYILLPTLLALIHPRLGRFNVTAKGGVVEEGFFDRRIARPFLLLIAFNVFGLLCAIPRFFQFPTVTAPGWLQFVNWPAQIYDGSHAGTIWVNVAWTLFNLTILGVATAVSWESRQRRQTVRVAMAVPSDVILADGAMIQGITSDLSGGGVRTQLNDAVKVQVGDRIKFVFPLLDGSATLPARVVGIDGNETRAQFGPLSLQEEEALTMLLYSRADTWLGLGEEREADRPLRSIGRILRLALRGLAHTLGGGNGKRNAPKSRLATSIAPVLLLGLLAGVSGRDVRAAQADAVTVPPVRAGTTGSSEKALPPAAAGSFDNVFTLSDAGVPSAVTLHGVDASHSVYFSVARNRLVKSATMKLRYHLSPGLLPGVSQLNVSLNGTMFASLAAGPNPSSGDQTGLLEATLNLPTDLLVHDNQLTFEFIGHYAPECEDPSNSTLWAQVDPNSTIELAGTFLPLTNDLSLLPLPFYDAGVNPHPVVPLVFLAPPSPKATQAAGIVASWFGILNGSRPVRFPVSFGAIPVGNTIVIAENAAEIPATLGVTAVSGPTVAMVANPSDPTSNVLLVAGSNEEELLTAAMALALHGGTWQGPRASIQDFTLPAPRKSDDAPRWLSTDKDKAVNLGQIAQTSELQGDGSVPMGVYLRLPPDLYFGERQNLPFHLSYRYDGVPLGAGSTLQVSMNGAYVSSTPLPHQDKASMVLETVVPVPVIDLRPFSNTMMLNFAFQPAKDGRCSAEMPANLQGVVLKDSYLDITDVPHWTELPNLELFANAGYPFTRKADLAETAVVLPDQPSAVELEMFLTMMGHFGAQTGYPVLSVTVTTAAGMSSDGRKDYLVMGTARDQPALKMLDRWLPVGMDGDALHVRDLHGLFDRFAWWRSGGSSAAASGLLKTVGGLPDALIEGIEWPGGSKRSVVMVVVRDETEIPDFLSTFLRSSQSSDIAQSVSVLHDEQFSSYRIGSAVYRSGEISPLTHVTLIFQQFPWLIAIVVALFCFLMAVLIQARLRRQARERLQGDD
jgi:cellulose synthase (UDP-forming)